jgi:hypothetical protein
LNGGLGGSHPLSTYSWLRVRDPNTATRRW